MKLILSFCLVIFSIQYSEQVGYEGTHVYHDGDEIHEHHPLPPDIQQISRGHYKRPERNRTEETSINAQTVNKDDNLQNVQENNKKTEIEVNFNVTLKPNIYKNDTDSQNSSSKENSDGNKKEQLNENKTDKPPTSSEHERENNKTEKSKETTSTQNNNNSIDETNKDIPKIVNNNEFSSTTIPSELEHGQTQKIYETYSEAYEAIMGKKFNQTKSDEKPNKEINSLNIGQNKGETGNPNNSQNKPKENNNNNSIETNIESEDGKKKIYDNYPDAFEGITGKTYNGSRETNTTVELEHGQSQKIYNTYPEAHEAITNKKPNITQNNEESNKEVNSSTTNPDIDIRIGIDNSKNKATENNNNLIETNIESNGDKNKLYDKYQDAFEGITGKTYNGSRENNSPIELEHGQTQPIYDTYSEAYEKITGKKYDGSQSNKEPTSTNTLPADNIPGSSSKENQSTISQENPSVPSGNEPTISANNGGNHESTDAVKQFVVNRGSSIIIQVGHNNCNTTVINCNGKVSSTMNVNNGTLSNKTSGGIKIIVNAIGKGNPVNASGRQNQISVIVGLSKHQPAKQIPCPPAKSVKNVLLSQFKEKSSLPSL